MLTCVTSSPLPPPSLLLLSIFDDDNSGTVDYKELIIGLEMFKENSIDEKLKGIPNLVDLNLLTIHLWRRR